MEPDPAYESVLPSQSYEGLHGTVLCVHCRFLGVGREHPEWCSWEILKARPEALANALSLIELGERAAAVLNPKPHVAENSF